MYQDQLKIVAKEYFFLVQNILYPLSIIKNLNCTKIYLQKFKLYIYKL